MLFEKRCRRSPNSMPHRRYKRQGIVSCGSVENRTTHVSSFLHVHNELLHACTCTNHYTNRGVDRTCTKLARITPVCIGRSTLHIRPMSYLAPGIDQDLAHSTWVESIGNSTGIEALHFFAVNRAASRLPASVHDEASDPHCSLSWFVRS